MRNIYVAQGDLLQATEPEDIIIIPGYQNKTSHALAISDMDLDGRAILFSTSWHGSYGMTYGQMNCYISFAREFFERFGRDCVLPK